MRLRLLAMSLLSLFVAGWAGAAPPRPKSPSAVSARPIPPQERTPASGTGLPGSVDRTTSIDFEDDIIEGMNKNPFDSLTRVGAQAGGAQGRIYRRKNGFRREIKQTVREMGYSP